MTTDEVDKFKLYIEKANSYHEKSLWQEKLSALLAAQECIVEGSPEAEKHTQQVLTEIGGIRRRFGQYEQGIKTLNQALNAYPSADLVTQAQILGEMGVMYRHRNDFDKALQTFNSQFQLASEAGTREGEIEMCRAIGNAGTSAYNLSQKCHPQDEKLLQTAIKQLQERIDRAQILRDRITKENPSSRYMRISHSWKVIGMDRLSLCYVAAGRTTEAVLLAEESQRIQVDVEPTVRAFSRFFYGNALWHDGQRVKAVQQWNSEPGICGPAAALCKEPSAENLEFLELLAEAGVDFSSYDEQGFSPLDYAVLSNTEDAEKMANVAIDALRKQFQRSTAKLEDTQIEEEVSRQVSQANLRRHYREVLQEHIRPELRDATSGSVRNVRRIYANILMDDPQRRTLLDDFHFVPYNEFKAIGKLPSVAKLESRVGRRMAKPFTALVDPDHNQALFVIFFSYRWIGPHSDPPVDGPDDSRNSQYRRMLSAIKVLLDQKKLDPDEVGIWIDCACISQSDKLARERGVNALPMAIIQCDAMISLMDDEYWDRAWCSVEVRLMRELVRSYHVYEWWEHRLDSPEADLVNGSLVPGAHQRDINNSKMSLTEEKIDRPKIDFLMRQSKLMGRDDA